MKLFVWLQLESFQNVFEEDSSNGHVEDHITIFVQDPSKDDQKCKHLQWRIIIVHHVTVVMISTKYICSNPETSNKS